MTAEGFASTLLALRGRTTCDELLGDMLDAAARYAHLRVNWMLRDAVGRAELDRARTSAHDVLIDSCNILSRAMLRAGEDNTWRADLGSDRGFIGDVACHLHCRLGLAAR